MMNVFLDKYLLYIHYKDHVWVANLAYIGVYIGTMAVAYLWDCLS
jgi:hypothetical protein